MVERNCHDTCPVKLLMGIEANETIGHQGPQNPTDLQLGLGLLGSLMSGKKSGDELLVQGKRYMNQGTYALTQCAMRNVTGPEWRPSQRCVDEAQSMAANMAPIQTQLPADQVARLGEIGLGPDLRQIGPAKG